MLADTFLDPEAVGCLPQSCALEKARGQRPNTRQSRRDVLTHIFVA